MTSSEDVPKASKRRVPWPLVTIAILLLAYAGLWLASSLMSSSLLEGAKLRLVDSSGQPVSGVAVLARWWQPKVYATGRDLGQSDENGIVDLQSLHGKTAVFGKFLVAVLLPGYDAEPTTLTNDTTIILPDVGSIVVQLRDEAGNAWSDSSIGHMRATLRWPKGQARQTFGPNGRAVFERVACASIELTSQLQGYRHSLAGETSDGPTASNETQHIDIAIPNDTPRLLGTVHDRSGKPVVDDFGFAMKSPEGSYGAFTITTGAAGSWQFLLLRQPTRGTVTLTHSTLGTVSAEIPSGEESSIDLGVLQFPH